MIIRHIHTLLLGLSLLFSYSANAQVSLKNWTIEDHSANARIVVSEDTLDITAPKGFTLWYNQRLTGEYEIHYRAKVLTQGDKYDRLSDLNCFWAANDPLHSQDIFARSKWRHGIFQHYKSLNLFYVGYGGNNNSTTRFRQYFATDADTDDSKARPVIKEYTDKQHLLLPNQWYDIRICVMKDYTSYNVNGEELFRLPIKGNTGDGHFGLRLFENHVLFTNFQVIPIE